MKRHNATEKLTDRAGTVLHRIKVWLNAPVMVRRRVGVKNVSRVPSLSGARSEVGAAALVLHVAWLAIFLGMAIEILLPVVSAVFGHTPKLDPLIADFAQRVSWSTIVCASISVALAASKLPVSFTGVAGMLSASVAFKIARAVQKGVGAALGVAPAVGSGPSPLVLGIIKAVEYGLLAATISWMAKRKERGAIAHATIGFTTGILFGTIVLAYTYSTNFKLFSMADAVSRGLNEVLFPVGCSLVLFATEVWAKQWKSAAELKVARV